MNLPLFHLTLLYLRTHTTLRKPRSICADGSRPAATRLGGAGLSAESASSKCLLQTKGRQARRVDTVLCVVTVFRVSHSCPSKKRSFMFFEFCDINKLCFNFYYPNLYLFLFLLLLNALTSLSPYIIFVSFRVA